MAAKSPYPALRLLRPINVNIVSPVRPYGVNYPAGKPEPGPSKPARYAYPAGTQLKIYWQGCGEAYTCTVSEWRMVRSAANGALRCIHRCDYEGGIIEHDLTQEEFEVLTTPADSSEQTEAPPPTSPLKGVFRRGTAAVWDVPVRVVKRIVEPDSFCLSPEMAVLVK